MEHELLLDANRGNILSENDRELLSHLAERFNINSRGICCQQFKLLSRARNVRTEEEWIYIGYLCTLNEERWHAEKILPYNDQESCPNNPIGDIWQDYQIDLPDTTVLKQQLCHYRDLDHTRRREECSQCRINEQNQCSQCKGRRSIITQTRLSIKRSNRSSTVLYPFSMEHFYSQLKNPTLLKNIECLDYDKIWSSTTQSLDSILNNCNGLPDGFKDELNRKFLTHHSSKILRLKCVIERLRIIKIDYQLQGLKDKTFTFYLIGEGRQLHTDESSYPLRSEQFNTLCNLL